MYLKEDRVLMVQILIEGTGRGYFLTRQYQFNDNRVVGDDVPEQSSIQYFSRNSKDVTG